MVTANSARKRPLRSVPSCEKEAHRSPRNEFSFYRECRNALNFFLRMTFGPSDIRSLFRKTLYAVLVSIWGGSDRHAQSYFDWMKDTACLQNVLFTWCLVLTTRVKTTIMQERMYIGIHTPRPSGWA